MKNNFSFFLILMQLVVSTWALAGDAKPKYGPAGSPKAVPLAHSNEYFRNPGNPAPAFWALISYYIPQSTGSSCSSATLAMTLNAARAGLKKSADDPVVSEKALWDAANIDHWKDLMSTTGYHGKFGFGLDELKKVTEVAFQKYGFPKVEVSVFHVEDQTQKTKAQLVGKLKELSSSSFIMANFNQKNFTDDAEVGHFAPLGAYDPVTQRVLVLDPDREYYEPYWVSINDVVSAMNTRDSSSKSYRGYLVVRSGSTP